jgi:hypothetical protein
MKLFPAVMIAGLLASGAAVATELDLSVNADAVKLGAEFDVTNNLRLGGNWLYHQDKGHVLTGDAHVTGNAAPSLQTLRAGLGLQLAYVDSDESTKEDGFGIPLGGFVRYTLPQYDRISFGGSLYYAPGVLSFGDLDSYLSWDAWAGYDVIRDATVYIGVRAVKPEFEEVGTQHIDTGMHFGVRIRLR